MEQNVIIYEQTSHAPSGESSLRLYEKPVATATSLFLGQKLVKFLNSDEAPNSRTSYRLDAGKLAKPQ